MLSPAPTDSRLSRAVRLHAAALVLFAAVAGCGDGGGDASVSTGPFTLPEAVASTSVPFGTTSTATAPAEPRADLAGFATGSALLGRPLVEIERDLDGIAATGVRWLRVDVDWSFVQHHGPDEWDWSRVDTVVREAVARGLSVVGLLTYTPDWARPAGSSDKHPPIDHDRFATFAAEAVRRYRDAGVRHWEVWNEPNVAGFWEPQPDASAYATLLVRAAAAIRAVDGGATVISGGLAPGADLDDGSQVRDATFLARLYEEGAGEAFDAVAVHPYSFPALPDEATAGYGVHGVGAVHAVMQQNGGGAKEVWATEMGAPTGGPGSVSPEQQARTAEQAFAAWRDLPWAGPMLWFSYRDEGADPSATAETFGLVTYEGTAKPALSAFTDAVATLPRS